MERTSATNGALILALNPLLGGLLEALFFRKRMGMNFVVGALLAVAGVCTVVLHQPRANWLGPSVGDLLVLGSMLAFAFGAVVLQRLSRGTSPLAINVFLYLYGTLALLAHALVQVESPVSSVLALGWLDWGVIVFSGALATALGAVAWGRGVAALGMGQASVYMSWVPVLGVGFGALLLNEPLTLWHLIGMVAVLLGTAISSMGLEWLSGKRKAVAADRKLTQ
ncbi:carboxylate/amino acid/amine transporter [compost metagenome]